MHFFAYLCIQKEDTLYSFYVVPLWNVGETDDSYINIRLSVMFNVGYYG